MENPWITFALDNIMALETGLVELVHCETICHSSMHGRKAVQETETIFRGLIDV